MVMMVMMMVFILVGSLSRFEHPVTSFVLQPKIPLCHHYVGVNQPFLGVQANQEDLSSDSSSFPLNVTNERQRPPPNNQFERTKPDGKVQPKKNQSIPSVSQHASKLLNMKLARAESAFEVLQILQHETKLGRVQAGGTMNSINFSTALHRLARHAANSKQSRAIVLQDPRTALLLASVAEALTNDKDTTIQFRRRELSNMCWALAKFKLPPPISAVAFNDNPIMLQEVAARVRQAVLTVATQRKEHGPTTASSSAATWIPALSLLAGYIMDYTGTFLMERDIRVSSSGSGQDNNQYHPKHQHPIQMQEYSNLLWAWATVDRANHQVFSATATCMIDEQRRKQVEETKPQEWSNSSKYSFVLSLCLLCYEPRLTTSVAS